MGNEGCRGKALVVTTGVGEEEREGEGRGEGERRGEGRIGRGDGKAMCEDYAHAYKHMEVFVWRYERLMNGILNARVWAGWLADVVGGVGL